MGNGINLRNDIVEFARQKYKKISKIDSLFNESITMYKVQDLLNRTHNYLKYRTYQTNVTQAQVRQYAKQVVQLTHESLNPIKKCHVFLKEDPIKRISKIYLVQVQEYHENTLNDFVQSNTDQQNQNLRLSEEEMLQIYTKLKELIQQLYEKKIYLDLKPENIYYNRKDQSIFVTNLCPYKKNSSFNINQISIREYCYLSPQEKLQQKFLGKQSYLWALGILLCQLIIKNSIEQFSSKLRITSAGTKYKRPYQNIDTQIEKLDISEQIKQAIKLLLRIDPQSREFINLNKNLSPLKIGQEIVDINQLAKYLNKNKNAKTLTIQNCMLNEEIINEMKKLSLRELTMESADIIFKNIFSQRINILKPTIQSLKLLFCSIQQLQQVYQYQDYKIQSLDLSFTYIVKSILTKILSKMPNIKKLLLWKNQSIQYNPHEYFSNIKYKLFQNYQILTSASESYDQSIIDAIKCEKIQEFSFVGQGDVDLNAIVSKMSPKISKIYIKNSLNKQNIQKIFLSQFLQYVYFQQITFKFNQQVACKNLKSLQFIECKFKSQEFKNNVLSSLENLRVLNLTKCLLNDSQISRMIQLSNISNTLQVLILSSNPISKQLIVVISQKLKNLHHLNIADNEIYNDSIHLIVNNLHQLKQLNLGYTRITNEALIIIGRSLKKLQYLRLDNILVSKTGLESLSTNLACLKVLQLSSCQIGDQQIQGFNTLENKLQSLEILELSFNSIGDVGATIISEKLQNLKYINLTSNELTINGTEKLINKLKKARCLFLERNKIDKNMKDFIHTKIEEMDHKNRQKNQFSKKMLYSL